MPEGFSLDTLVGRQLNQVCIGAHDLQFRFEGSTFIGGDGKVAIEIGMEKTEIVPGDNWGNLSFLTRVVGRDVTAWRVEGTHEFSLTLTDGPKLRFFSEDSPFEDWVVSPQQWVV